MELCDNLYSHVKSIDKEPRSMWWLCFYAEIKQMIFTMYIRFCMYVRMKPLKIGYGNEIDWQNTLEITAKPPISLALVNGHKLSTFPTVSKPVAFDDDNECTFLSV